MKIACKQVFRKANRIPGMEWPLRAFMLLVIPLSTVPLAIAKQTAPNVDKKRPATVTLTKPETVVAQTVPATVQTMTVFGRCNPAFCKIYGT